MNRDERIEKAREFWQSEMDRVGPDWDTAEIMENYATEREAGLVAALERITYYASEHADHCSCDMCEIFRITENALKEHRGER